MHDGENTDVVVRKIMTCIGLLLKAAPMRLRLNHVTDLISVGND